MDGREPGQYWVIVAEGDVPEVARWDGDVWFTHREPDPYHDYAVIHQRVFRVGPPATPSGQIKWDIPTFAPGPLVYHPDLSMSNMVQATLTNADLTRRLSDNMTRNNALLRHLNAKHLGEQP